MKKLNWKKAIGYALLLWVIMFVVVSILIAFKWYDGSGLMAWVVAVVGGVVSLILAGYLRPATAGAAFGYGAAFVIIGVVLDAIITTRFNAEIFRSVPLWVSYALVLLAPLLRIRKSTPPVL